jgi:sugar diacid utilization regulator
MTVDTVLDHPPASLERVVTNLGRHIVEVLAAPVGLDVVVTGTVIQDPHEPPHLDAGDLVLAVGVSPDSAAEGALLGAAAKVGAAAVAVKCRATDHPRLVELATRAGIALLAVTPEITWAQLHSLVRTSMLIAGPATADDRAGATADGDLFRLANSISSTVGGAVLIEDPQLRVLAYSSGDDPVDEDRRQTILGRSASESVIREMDQAGVFRRLWGSTDVVRVDETFGWSGDRRPRLAIAVRAGEEILGSIWVVEGNSPFSPDAEAALRDAARIATLHMLRHRLGEEVDARVHNEMLRSLLDGHGPLEQHAERLGLDTPGRFAVMAVELVRDAGADSDALLRQRAASLVAMHCQAFRRRATQMTIGRCVYVLLPLTAADTPDGLSRLARDIVDRPGRSLTLGLRIGIGGIAETLSDICRARNEADTALRVLRLHRRNLAVARVDEVQPTALLLELRDLAPKLNNIRGGKLARLTDHDDRHGTDYVESLRVYLDCVGSAPEAAARIGVHANTFRYRLKRIEEVSHVDLDDPIQRLALELELRLS